MPVLKKIQWSFNRKMESGRVKRKYVTGSQKRKKKIKASTENTSLAVFFKSTVTGRGGRGAGG